MCSPGRRRAFKALASRRKTNVNRVAKGLKPIVAGKKVSPGTIGLSKTKAKRIIANR